MSKISMLTVMLTMLALCGASASLTFGQEGGQRRGPAGERGADRTPGERGGGERGGGGGGDRGDFRARMAERFKQGLDVSDEEWQVLQPRIEKVQTLQIQTRGGMGAMGMGGQGGPGGFGGRGGAGGGEAPQTELSKAMQELRAALEAKADNGTIKSRLDAVRKARAKAREELTAAQDELRGLVNLKQEAFLVSAGLLE